MLRGHDEGERLEGAVLRISLPLHLLMDAPAGASFPLKVSKFEGEPQEAARVLPRTAVTFTLESQHTRMAPCSPAPCVIPPAQPGCQLKGPDCISS